MRGITRVAAVLPETYWGEEEWRNAEPALKYVDEAAGQGVQLLVFPEGYPGPMTGTVQPKQLSFKPLEALQEKARQHGMYIAAGEVEENPTMPQTYFLTLKLISPEGEILARYLRMQPMLRKRESFTQRRLTLQYPKVSEVSLFQRSFSMNHLLT